MKKWTKGNRASICHWDLTVRFLVKKQMNKFVRLLIDAEIDYNFEYSHEDMDGPYDVRIYDGIWANNLVTIGKLLKKVDYYDEMS